jgi:hypothetical protein
VLGCSALVTPADLFFTKNQRLQRTLFSSATPAPLARVDSA